MVLTKYAFRHDRTNPKLRFRERKITSITSRMLIDTIFRENLLKLL